MDSERAFGLFLLATATVLTLLLFRPFVTVVLSAILIAYLLGPLYRRLTPRIGERPAAVGLIFAAIVLVVIPFVVLLGVALSGLQSLLQQLRDGATAGGFDGVSELLESTFATDFDVQESVLEFVQGGHLGEIFRTVIDVVGGVSELFISLTILLFLSYYLLKNGDDLVAWMIDQLPLPKAVTTELIDRADKLLFAVFVGNTATAVADGVLVGLGLLVTGFSDVIFWTFLAVFLALIPLVGTTVIWIPAAVYLVLIGNTILGVLLFLYGVFIVGAVDNVIRPYFGATEVGLSPPLYIFGVFSGISLFGFVGIYFGPFVLAFSKILFDTLGGVVRRDEATG